jgi:O-antigen/teichoic acid export membrane protein
MNIFLKILKNKFFHKIFKGSLWLTLGTFLSRFFFSLSFIILARMLTAEEYGEYGIIKSTIDSFLIFATAGLGITSTKFISEFRDNANLNYILGSIFSLVSITGIITCFIIICGADFISVTFLHKPNLSLGLRIASLTLLFASYNAIQLGTLLGFKDFKGQTYINIIQGIVFFIFVVSLASFQRVNGAVLGMLLTMLCTVIFSSYRVWKIGEKNDIYVKLNLKKDNLKKILSFSLPTVASSLIVIPVFWILNVILVNQENGYRELGTYNAVYIIPSLVILMNNIIGNAILPYFLDKEEKNNNKYKFRRNQVNYLINWIVSIFISLILITYPEVISYILSENYPVDKIRIILIISMCSVILISHRQGIARNLILKNKMWLSVYSMFQFSITTLFCFYFWMKNIGAEGLALSIFIGYFTNTLIFVPYFIYRKLAPQYIFIDKRVNFVMLFSLSIFILNIFIDNIIIRSLVMILSIIILVWILLNYLCDEKVILEMED